MKLPMHRTLVARLTGLFALLLMLFAVVLELLFNAMMERKMIAHYSKTMQRNAYAISQNLSEMIAPSDYEALDENPFIVGEDTLAPYMALIEHITNCNVYLIDEQHRVTGYFDGVVQTMSGRVLPNYIEQTIALGFMGKTPFLSAKIDGETHLTTSMPIMNAKSHVLGVVLLESTLRELGFAQVSSSDILLFSGAVAFALTALLGALFSRMFTQPITAVQRFAGRLASGEYDARMQNARKDEIGELARSMDILAERLDDARRRAYIGQMLAECKGLQRMIIDLLELSRLQNAGFSLNMGEVDVRELLGDVAMSVGALCERKGVVFVCSEPQCALLMTGDYARLRQMLLAVLDNAVKFTPAGKRVSLSMEGHTVIVADEGIGIPEEELAHIFERFRRTRGGNAQGTGLGLAICSEVARRHDIRIDVTSRVSAGTTFRFTFPDGGR